MGVISSMPDGERAGDLDGSRFCPCAAANESSRNIPKLDQERHIALPQCP